MHFVERRDDRRTVDTVRMSIHNTSCEASILIKRGRLELEPLKSKLFCIPKIDPWGFGVLGFWGFGFEA